jgi:hypothetical protein
MHKRGQLTIIIIVGILIVLVVAGIILIQRKVSLEPLSQKIPETSQIAFEVQPVRDFVQTCVLQVGKQGLRDLGDHGGYINPTLRTNLFEPTEGDGVTFAPQSDLVIPYWFHMASDNDCEGNCVFSSERPVLDEQQGQVSVQGQLNQYVTDNLPNCLQNFNALQDDYSISPDGPISVRTTIAERSVHFFVEYPLTVRRGDAAFEINDYLATADVNLREIFTLATDLANIEAETRFLEQYSRNLIDAFSEIDSNALPPVTGFVIDYGPGEIWIKKDVEDQLKQILHAYLPLLQVHGSRNYRFIEAPRTGIEDTEMYEVLYNRGAIIPINNTPKDVNVKFSFLDWWKPYVDLNCRGQVCQSESASSTFGFIFGMQRYSFAYDLSYPVLVEIENPDAFNNEGYSFKFFLESNTRNNKPLKTNFQPLKSVDIPTGSMLCDIEKRYSGDINIKVVNGRTNRLLDKSYPSFNCGDESCAFNAIHNGTGTTTMPLCLGGILGVETQDAHPTFVPFDTLLNESQNVTVVVEPFRRVRFDIKNYVLRKSGNAWELDTSNAVAQESDEEVIIQLDRIGNDYEEPFSTFGRVNGDVFSRDPTLSENIPIIPGRYKVILTGFKYADPPVNIPARTLNVDTGGFTGGESVDIPGISFNVSNPLPTIGV